jgi:hypothetical protein
MRNSQGALAPGYSGLRFAAAFCSYRIFFHSKPFPDYFAYVPRQLSQGKRAKPFISLTQNSQTTILRALTKSLVYFLFSLSGS